MTTTPDSTPDSTPGVRTVHAVVFDPINGHAVGGFDWFPQRADADEHFTQLTQDDPRGHRVRQYVVDDVPADLDREGITAWIDKHFVADRTEDTPVSDNYHYTVLSPGVQEGDNGRDYVHVEVERANDEDATVTVHQSVTDQPALNIEIDGDFAGETSTAAGALRVHLNDWPIYISQLSDSELSADELRQYERVLSEQLSAVQDVLRHL